MFQQPNAYLRATVVDMDALHAAQFGSSLCHKVPLHVIGSNPTWALGDLRSFEIMKSRNLKSGTLSSPLQKYFYDVHSHCALLPVSPYICQRAKYSVASAISLYRKIYPLSLAASSPFLDFRLQL